MRVLTTFFAFSLLLALPLRAEPGADKKEEIKARFEEGQKYYRVGEYEKALSSYKAAYLLEPLPEFLFNMAQCYRLLKRYEDALRAYQFFLQDVPDTPLRAEVEKIIGELEEAIWAESAPASVPIQDSPRKPGKRLPTARWVISGALLVGGVGLGVGAGSLLRDGEVLDAQERRLGRGLALAADLSFLSAGAVLLSTFLRKKPAPERAGLSFGHRPAAALRAP